MYGYYPSPYGVHGGQQYQIGGGQQYQLSGPPAPWGYAPHPQLHHAAVHGYAIGDAQALTPEEMTQLAMVMRHQQGQLPSPVYQAVSGCGYPVAVGAYQIGADPIAQPTQVVAPNPLVPGQFGIQRQDPTERRQLIIGFDSVDDVPAGGTLNVPTTLQDVFRGNRLIVPGTVAPAFIVTDVRVGTKSQLSSQTGIPAEAFVPEALSPIRLDTAQVGQQISITVTNRSGGGSRFLAAMYGDAAR